MITLFVDTHFKDINLCLYKDNNIIKISERKNATSTSENTLPDIIQLLNSCGVNVKEINKIIVCNGPGSFTGIRIGITIAKILAYALKAKLYSINSLELHSLDNKEKNQIGIRENNGVYTALFDGNKMISEIIYFKNNDLNLQGDKINFIEKINYTKLINYKYLKEESVFDAKPIYIKKIEALNDKNAAK